MSIQIQLLSNGNLQVKTDQAITLEDVWTKLDLSKEKKKHVQILKGAQSITNPQEEINPSDKISVVIDDTYDFNEETPDITQVLRLYTKMTGRLLSIKNHFC